jgi:predicted glycosyltransferase
MFFKNAVTILQEKGHEVLCTSREYREAVELARIKGLDLKLVGRHGGPERYGKLAASTERMRALAEVVNGFGPPDVAVTFSSPEGARVAFGLGIRHIGFNDSPHAEAVARLTVPLMSKLLCPWVIPYSAWTGFGISKNNISRYHALDPAAWLKHPDRGNVTGNSEHKADKNKKVVLVRLEESKASYIADKKLASTELVDYVIEQLSQRAEIVVLCRYNDQIDEAKARYQDKAKIIESVVDGISLIKSADLFIGAGGTMSAEAALLGIPTISIAPVRYHVEDYLAKSGLVVKTHNKKLLAKLGFNILSNEKIRANHSKKAARTLASMEDPTKKMVAEILGKAKDHKL